MHMVTNICARSSFIPSDGRIATSMAFESIPRCEREIVQEGSPSVVWPPIPEATPCQPSWRAPKRAQRVLGCRAAQSIFKDAGPDNSQAAHKQLDKLRRSGNLQGHLVVSHRHATAATGVGMQAAHVWAGRADKGLQLGAQHTKSKRDNEAGAHASCHVGACRRPTSTRGWLRAEFHCAPDPPGADVYEEWYDTLGIKNQGEQGTGVSDSEDGLQNATK